MVNWQSIWNEEAAMVVNWVEFSTFCLFRLFLVISIVEDKYVPFGGSLEILPLE